MGLKDKKWADDYLQQAAAIRFYIKLLKRQLNCDDCSEQNAVKARIDMLYGMYLYRGFFI